MSNPALLKQTNFTSPLDVERVFEEFEEPKEYDNGATHTKTDGYNLDKIFKSFTYLSDIIPSGPNRINMPVIMARGVDINEGLLEGIVKEILGKRIHAKNSPELASKIITALFLEGKIADGLVFKRDEPILEEVVDYLHGVKGLENFGDLGEKARMRIEEFYKTAAEVTGVPNVFEFKKAIMSMDVARPGDVAYDKNSALGKVINYVAGLKDNPVPGYKDVTPRRLRYLQDLIVQLSAGGQGLDEFIYKFNKILPKGMQLNRTATIKEVLTKWQEYVGTLDSQYKASNPTTFTKNMPNIAEHYAGEPKATAYGLHGRS